jgi:ParB-like chromosome segregation protein Spo0J
LPLEAATVELDLHRLELRFEATRVTDQTALKRLTDSIQEYGQMVACIAAGQAGDAHWVLVDGYRRVAALKRLGRDTAQVQCWTCPLEQALTQILARSRSRAFAAIEEALLLR